MQSKRWTAVCNCRTTKCSYLVRGPDTMDNDCRYKVGVLNKVADQCMSSYCPPLHRKFICSTLHKTALWNSLGCSSQVFSSSSTKYIQAVSHEARPQCHSEDSVALYKSGLYTAVISLLELTKQHRSVLHYYNTADLKLIRTLFIVLY